MNKDVMTWTCVPNAVYQTQEELNLFLQNPTFKEHYDAIIGQSTPMCIIELEDAVLPSDVPDMKLVASDLKAPEFHIGDLYVGTIEGRRCMGTMHDFAGLYVITAGEPEMTNKTATQLLFETQQKEIETRVFKEKLLQLMKARLDKATRAFHLHMGQHGRIQGLNQQLSTERIKLQEEMMKLRDIVANIGKDKVLMTDMTMTFLIQDEENIVLRLIDTEILDFLKS